MIKIVGRINIQWIPLGGLKVRSVVFFGVMLVRLSAQLTNRPS
jgi:hypothetical protein